MIDPVRLRQGMARPRRRSARDTVHCVGPFLRLLAAVALLAAVFGVSASPLAPKDVPKPLQPWIDWVLFPHQDRDCTLLFNAPTRRCAWPGPLKLSLDNLRGSFEQGWMLHDRDWVGLPGDRDQWPQEVAVDGEPAVVLSRKGRPVVEMEAGRHRVTGVFHWPVLPESMAVPPDLGVVHLRLNGRNVDFPEFDRSGRIWLRERGVQPQADEEDRLGLQVFRKIIDGNPMRVVTRVDLQVAGAQREVVLEQALLDGFIPLRLDSRLPARMESDGRLWIQLRPGRWSLELVSRHPQEVTRLQAPSGDNTLWPRNEVWVFEARPGLRLVEVEGVPPIDPRQTRLPSAWQKLPAYRLGPGESMELNVLRRGDPEPEPDDLRLQRTLWLDFDGGGYTFQDRITGTMTRGWRLEAEPNVALGRVTVGGQPQFITRLPESSGEGVEVRRGQIDLGADSRYTRDRANVPATGWQQDFRQVSAVLNLPPGWRLLSASGIDQVRHTWFQRWTLLDLFLVLVAAIAVGKLWRWPWGILALATLGLTWLEADAPRYVWLNILAALALLRVLPPGRMQRLVRWYRNLALLALAVLAVPFMVDQVRIGLYPQLERPWQDVGRGEAPVSGALTARTVTGVVPEVAEDALKPRAPLPAGAPVPAQESRSKRLLSSADTGLMLEFDPNARIQTGPGLPQWGWTRVQLTWNGPVEAGQYMSLRYLSPPVNLVLSILRVVLVAALALRLLGIALPRPGRKGVVSALLVLPLMVLLPDGDPVHAQGFPSDKLLGELEARLLVPPECLPDCAQTARMWLSVDRERLGARVELQAAQRAAVPLPFTLEGWMPDQVLLDGENASGVYRTTSGDLWVEVGGGVHQLLVSGPVPERTHLRLALPMPPHHVNVEADGWTVEGVDERGVPDPQLQLTRIRSEREASTPRTSEPVALPPFLRVERTLRLGLEWQVATRVIRVSPKGQPILLQVPLLEGESVVTEGVRSRDDRVLVSMGSAQAEFHWDSTLEHRSELLLTASTDETWSELWRADIGPMWHVELSGIPVVHQGKRERRWLPEWRPWPGEQATLKVTRPEGVEGPTLTLQASKLRLVPGLRSTDGSLELELRSSQGGQHAIKLPQGARLHSVAIDGHVQPVRQQERVVNLPIEPGEHRVALEWRQPGGIGLLYRTPEVDLGVISTNSNLTVVPGRDRWVLLTGGPRMGPAVLFWGVLLVILLLAVGLARTRLTPLKTWHWVLLGVGLSQSPIWVGLIVVGWLLALGGRERWTAEASNTAFNLVQVGLATLTLVALIELFAAVQQGLLGSPDMQIAGNRSSANALNWYQDRSGVELPRAWVFSAPLVVYRLMMLAWALWLAFALVGWLRWGWQCFSRQGLWREIKIDIPKRSRKAPVRPRPRETQTRQTGDQGDTDPPV